MLPKSLYATKQRDALMKKLGVNIIAAFIFGVLAASAHYYLIVKNRIDDLNRMVINNQSAISEARKDLSGIIGLIDDISSVRLNIEQFQLDMIVSS